MAHLFSKRLFSGLTKLAISTLMASALSVQAASLKVTIAPANDVKDLSGAVVYLVNTKMAAPSQSPATPIKSREIAQQGRLFEPYISVIQTGTEVEFPNRDSVAHHVYSFSAARAFELPLYKGDLAPNITFTQPGLVTLGCNIHDWMLGYILVLDTPYYEQLNGLQAQFADVPPGQYLLSFWTPGIDQREVAQLLIEQGDNDQTVTMTLTHPVNAIQQPQPPESSIDESDDYL